MYCADLLLAVFTWKNTTAYVEENDKFETFFKCLPLGDPTIHYVFVENEGGLGKFMQTNLSEYNEDYHSFQDLCGKFFHSKAIHLF